MPANGHVPGFAERWLVPLAEECLLALVALRVLRQLRKQDAMPEQTESGRHSLFDDVFRLMAGGSPARKVNSPVTVEIQKIFWFERCADPISPGDARFNILVAMASSSEREKSLFYVLVLCYP